MFRKNKEKRSVIISQTSVDGALINPSAAHKYTPEKKIENFIYT